MVIHRFFAPFKTLRGRLVSLICFATLPAFLFTFYVANTERTSVLKRVEKDAFLLAQLASREHAHQMEGAKALLIRLGDMLGHAPRLGAQNWCPKFLPPLLAGYPQFTTIGVLAPSGDLICSAYPVIGHINMKSNSAFLRALGSTNVEIGDYTVGPVINRPLIHMAYAIRNQANVPQVVVFVGLELRWLAELTKQAELPPEYSLLIADQHGQVLIHSGGGIKSAQDGILPFTTLTELAGNGQRSIVVKMPGIGKKLLVAAPLSKIAGVSIIAALPLDYIFGPANYAFLRTVLALSFLTLFTIACTLFAAEISVLRILRQLTGTVRHFGAGNVAARMSISPNHGELTELARAFNTMANDIETRQREALEIQNQLRALSHRLVLAREDEAGRIARELHDELGQVLTSVKIDLISARVPTAELSARIDEAVNVVRRVSSDLRPAVLDRLGLVPALEWLTREYEARTSLAVMLEIDHVVGPIDWPISITIFRIVQEAFTNILRHANATEVCVNLCCAADEFVLTVRDNGSGIDAATLDNVCSLGLLGMKERTSLVNGQFEICSNVDQGTTITIRIPKTETDKKNVTHSSC